MHVRGTSDRLILDGGVRFAQTEVRVPMIGTSFRLSSDTIRIDDSRVIFDDYTPRPEQKAADDRRRGRSGRFQPHDGRPRARASDFQAVDVARKEGTSVYGKAYLDLDATAKGPWTNSSSAGT